MKMKWSYVCPNIQGHYYMQEPQRPPKMVTVNFRFDTWMYLDRFGWKIYPFLSRWSPLLELPNQFEDWGD